MAPVLYLDIDDTLLNWADGKPRPVPGTHAFMRWALDHFEVRWLTRWCPSGTMPEHLLVDLAKMVRIDPGELASIQGWNWDYSGTKVDGISWVEHLAMGREFVWIENGDGLSNRDYQVLEQNGLRHCHLDCNVTTDLRALDRTRRELERRFDLAPAGAEPRRDVA